MHRNPFATAVAAVGFAALAAGPVAAQENQNATTAGPEPARQCIDDLRQFTETLAQDQFWVRGWGQSWGYGVGPGVIPPDAPARFDPAEPTAPPGVSPWIAGGADFQGLQSPRFQIQSLYQAAYVLAYQGSQDGCEYLLARLQDTYSGYVAQLEEAGVSPDAVNTWRQEQLALARPVSEIEAMGRFTVDDLTGTDVRNVQDEYLGSISDVAFDAQNGTITYVILARGGFLGIGEEYVAVPWNMFRATPGFNTMILDVPEATLAQAPTIDPANFGDSSAMATQDEQVNRFWEQQS